MTIHTHVFADADEDFFRKQIPDFGDTLDGVRFTFGMDLPDDMDVLIVYGRASYSLPIRIARSRTIFVASEPDEIRVYSPAFLNQFGLVMTSSAQPLETRKLRSSLCYIPFVGRNYDDPTKTRNIHSFADMPIPPKDDRISVVTSGKAHTEFHKKRLQFLEVIRDKIPDHLELYGRDSRPVADKMDALIGHKYHLALENGGGPFSWTEKLSDPLLCWALPFYHGCVNYEDDLPAHCAVPITLDDPDATINQMMHAVETNIWRERQKAIGQARHLILTRFNLLTRFAALSRKVMAEPAKHNKRGIVLKSERALPPPAGATGKRRLGYLARTALLTVAPGAELRAAQAKQWLRARRKG